MSLALNVDNWWECSGDELWAMNLRRSNFVAQKTPCYITPKKSEAATGGVL